MTVIVTPISFIGQNDAHVVWAGPIVAASVEMRWVADRIAELLDDFGISDDCFQDIEVTHALTVSCSDAWLLWLDGLVIAVCNNWTMAQRVAHLLDRYGLADVPDDISEVSDDRAA